MSSYDDAWQAALAHFDAEQYREALLDFEECWHQRRGESLRAFILLSNALNQLRLGLHQGPHRNLGIAATLLASAPAQLGGVALAPVRAYAEQVRALVPANGPAPEWATIPRLQLQEMVAKTKVDSV